MRAHYDFSKMKGHKNPYFKSMSEETGVPYQSLINLYLRDCAVHHRKLHMTWYPENAEQSV